MQAKTDLVPPPAALVGYTKKRKPDNPATDISRSNLKRACTNAPVSALKKRCRAEEQNAAVERKAAAVKKAADAKRIAVAAKKRVADKARFAAKKKLTAKQRELTVQKAAERKAATDVADTPKYTVPIVRKKTDAELQALYPEPIVVPNDHVSSTQMRAQVFSYPVVPEQQEHFIAPTQQPAPDALTIQEKKKLIGKLASIARDATNEPTPMHDAEEDIIGDMVQDTSNDTLFAAECNFCKKLHKDLVKWDDLLMCKSCQL